jgi:dGTPase
MEWNKLLSENRKKETTRKTTDYDLRTQFESDYGRIVFSPAIRRMHDKTQVFPLTDSDNIHSRLTHSLEVESVAQSIIIDLIEKGVFDSISDDKGLLIRNLTKIIASISLCHDIGNPPFGHFGEEVIAKYFEEYFERNACEGLSDDHKKDFTKFNGNAQGFRVLTKLQVLQDTNGLNLTAATLASFLKYPNLSSELTKKFYNNKLGVYQSEIEHLVFIRKETGIENKRHPLSFLMEAADSICYYTMDIEDGFNKKYYTFNEVVNFFKENGNEDVKKYIERTIPLIDKKVDFNNKNAEQTQIVNFRIYLIQHLVEKAVKNFIDNYDSIMNGSYIAELIFDDKDGVNQHHLPLAKVLQKFTVENIFSKREIQKLELTGESVIRGLLDHFVDSFINYKKEGDKYEKRAKKLFSLISNSLTTIVFFETNIKELSDWNDYYKLRVIVDYISGMTDGFALNLYQELQGIKQ